VTSAGARPVVYVRGQKPPAPGVNPEPAGPRAFGTGGEPCDLVAIGSGAAQAVRMAAEHPELVDQLVLVGPDGDLALAEQVQCLTLIVQGSEDERDIGRELKRRIRASYLCYVYGAGHDVEADQPARLKALIDEFLERGEAFIINWKENESSNGS